MKKTSLLLMAGALLLTALPSFAQDKTSGGPPPGPPTRMRATIEKVDNGTLTVKTDTGQDATVTVTPKTNIAGVAARKLTDIKSNDFIGVTAMTDKAGAMHATEIHIFPEQGRGTGEGHYPWDKGANSSMTNAAVSGMVDSSDGKTFTMSYKNKMSGKTDQVKIDASPGIPIVAFVPGDASLMKVGAKLVLFAHKNDDGTYMALAVVAEKDGVKPPM